MGNCVDSPRKNPNNYVKAKKAEMKIEPGPHRNLFKMFDDWDSNASTERNIGSMNNRLGVELVVKGKSQFNKRSETDCTEAAESYVEIYKEERNVKERACVIRRDIRQAFVAVKHKNVVS